MEEIRQYSILKNLAACKHWKSANSSIQIYAVFILHFIPKIITAQHHVTLITLTQYIIEEEL